MMGFGVMYSGNILRLDKSSFPRSNFTKNKPGKATVFCRSSVSHKSVETVVAADLFADKTIYKDSWLDKFFINYFYRKQSEQVGGFKSNKIGYDAFVDVSKEIVRGRSALQQQEVIDKVLHSLLPKQAPANFRRFFPPTKWSCELNAFITTYFFKWLVGDMELIEVEIEKEDGTKEMWNSQVHIKKCRYLENSGCVGMCVNMCKLPTQKFFTDDFGLPLTMNPDFENLSCEMIFGQSPPPAEEDPASNQPCFSICNIVKNMKDEACPRLDHEDVNRQNC
eukprot:TRINITY_DN7194_c0_g1_i2.p1 TRINITY_DN7194_c0_g1~~TRINITY_DN7194_c0_g1_i2.p1  ORF type:complete len:279 (-),score=24.17 TRINITY_DN7194_c0_g1_i2:375-1211(-)